MRASIERAAVDLLEVLLLADHVGETFVAVVVDRDSRGTDVMLAAPPVMARVRGEVGALGETVTLRLAAVDVDARRVELEPVT